MVRFLNGARWIFGGRAQRAFYVQLVVWCVLITGTAVLWFELKPEIQKEKTYLIRLENILVCNPPPWISNDFVSEALKNLPFDRKLDALNALDPDLADVLTVAFAAHPWVAQVEKVEIFYPAQIKIYLKFRRPVAIIDPALTTIRAFHDEINIDSGYDVNFLNALSQSDRLAHDYNSERYVVDETGYRLPDEYLQNYKNAYSELPIIYGVYWGSSTTPGSPLDNYLADSALLASFLKNCDALEKLEISQIFILRKYGQTKGVYFLRTKTDATCLWGYFALDRETRLDETYSGERNAPKLEESKKKLFTEQRVKLERWSEEYKKATSEITPSKTPKGELKNGVYFSVATKKEILE